MSTATFDYNAMVTSFDKSYDDKTTFNLSSFKALFEQIATKLASSTDDNVALNSKITEINNKIPQIKAKFAELTESLTKYDLARREDLRQLQELIKEGAALPKIEESIDKLQNADKEKSAKLLQTATQLDNDLSEILGSPAASAIAPTSNSAKDTVDDLFNLINQKDYTSILDAATALNKIKTDVMVKNTKFYLHSNDDNYKQQLLTKLNQSDKFKKYGFTLDNISNLFVENSDEILDFTGGRKTRRRKNKRRKTVKKYGGYQTETKKHKKKHSKRSSKRSSARSSQRSSKRSSSDSVNMRK